MKNMRMIIKPIPIDKPIEETEETLKALGTHSERTRNALGTQFQLINQLKKLRKLWGHSEGTLRALWGHSEGTRNALGTHSERTRNALGTHSERTRNALWAHSERTLSTLWAHSEYTLNTLWAHSEDMPKIWQNLKKHYPLTHFPTRIQEMPAHRNLVIPKQDLETIEGSHHGSGWLAASICN